MASSPGLTGLLGGYGSDSDEAQDKEQEGQAHLKPIMATDKNGASSDDDDGDDDDDDDDSDEQSEDEDGRGTGGRVEDANGKSPPRESTDLLPSVDDLFSSTAGPDFLSAPSTGDDFVVATMKKRSNAPSTGHKRARDEGAVRGVGNMTSGLGAGARAGNNTTSTASSGLGKKPRDGGVGPMGPPQENAKKNAGEKISAKDKVKGQRLRGQSGIGSDFRVWKSDLEMTFRQQYD